MARLALALALALPCVALSQEGVRSGAPTGPTAAVSLGGGGELGLDEREGKAGVFELEALVGWEFASVGVRPEIAGVLGIAPDFHGALRPGVRFSLPRSPIQLRVALDAANARDHDFRWRWLLFGVALETRLTSLLGLYAEADAGVKLSSKAGLPLLVRGGASLRF